MDEVLPVLDLAPLVRLLGRAAAGQPNNNPPLITAAELDADPEAAALCRRVARCLSKTSCLLVRDPRVPAEASAAFLDALEDYFARPEEEKMRDARPALHYQVGATPPGVETPRCVTDPQSCADALAGQAEGHRATPPTGADAKWRFFWRLGERPRETAFPELNAEAVVPRGCEAWWPGLMDAWGARLLAAAEAVAVAAAHGLGVAGGPHALAELMRGGPHLLAPTGSDLSLPFVGGGGGGGGGGLGGEEEGGKEEEEGAGAGAGVAGAGGRATGGPVLKPGAVLAGFHQDLNFLTVHSKARYPGLFVWLRDGTRLPVRVPEGCLLLQAGKQLEHLTGGVVKAGWHEVIATEEALALARRRVLERQEEEEEAEGGGGGRRRAASARAWRVSSTVFAHAASDRTLEPLLPFARAAAGAGAAAGERGEGEGEEEAWRRRYAPVKAGAQVQAELEAIKLAAATG